MRKIKMGIMGMKIKKPKNVSARARQKTRRRVRKRRQKRQQGKSS